MLYGSIFHVIAEENQGDDGGSCFIKKILFCLTDEGAIQTISKCSRGTNGD